MENIISLFIISLGLILALFVFWKLMRKRENYKRTLSLCFLKVSMPKRESDLDEKKETQKDFKETIAIMEQLLASMKSIYSGKIKKRFLGQDILSFEYVVEGSEIYFYIVCPKKYQALIEKQITWYYQDAVIEETPEINIFAGRKYFEWTYIFTKKPFYYPIKTYQKLESDPINTITNAFSKLGEDESAVLQILLKPIDDDWQEKCTKMSSKLMSGKKHYFTLNPLELLKNFANFLLTASQDANEAKSSDNSALTQERSKTVDEKWDKTWYEVIIRIVTTGNNKHLLHTELTNIISSFSQFSYPDFNKFKYTTHHSNNALVRNYIYRYFKRPFFFTRRMILNTEEIASLFHLPHSKYNKTPEIKWQNFKIVKAPASIPKEWLILGHNIHRGIKKEIRIKSEDRFRHFYVIGQTGTWKSSILQSMARQDLKQWRGIAVLDPHGDLANDLLPFIPRERADDVIIFDPSDTSRPMGINIFEAHTDEEKELVTLDATNIMIKLFWNEIFGPRIQDYFKNAALTLMDYPQGWAITDVIALFTNEDFRKDHVNKVKNPIVKAWWEKTYASMWDREKGEIIPYFAAKFSGFITNSVMRNIVWQVKSSFDISEVMNSGKILMIKLSKWILGDLNSELLGLILVSKIQIAAMRRQNLSKEERRDFFLYIDEFQNYITPSIESILSEARKYRLGLILAHQYLGQLEKSDALTKSNLNLKNAIFWNVGTIMSYKVWPEDGEFLSKYYAPTFSDQDLMNMDKFKAVMKLSVDNQPSTPFSIIPLNPYLEQGDPKIGRALYELSRLKYGRDRAFVAKEIEYRIWSF